MGWLFTQGQTRKELVKRLTKSWTTEDRTNTCVKQCTRGNVLWSVWHITNDKNIITDKWLRCDLMKNGGNDGWGYKDMCESMGPHYYSCPLSYFDGVPVVNYKWREKVYKYHFINKKRMAMAQVGKTVELQYCVIPHAKIISKKPLIGVYEGRRYRIKKQLIKIKTER